MIATDVIAIMRAIAKGESHAIGGGRWIVSGITRPQPRVAAYVQTLLIATVEPVPPNGELKSMTLTHSYSDVRRWRSGTPVNELDDVDWLRDMNESQWQAVQRLADDVVKWITNSGDTWLRQIAENQEKEQK